MSNNIDNKCRPPQTKFSFGATSAIMTILGLIAGLDTLAHPKLSIIGGILVIAIADNISDSMGIHIYQESECIARREVWLSTATNFLTRLLVSLSFIILIIALPMRLAVISAMVWGLVLLALMSYAVAKNTDRHPFRAIFEHMSIAIVIITASHFIGRFVIEKLKSI